MARIERECGSGVVVGGGPGAAGRDRDTSRPPAAPRGAASADESEVGARISRPPPRAGAG
ncbi:hypothetical protein QJS66_18525 [Kocuria rhizophila]|nr:hypothetical protein QJS66_18525 [Kocuria rhizophila]